MRSKFPDLIFKDVLEKRTQKIINALGDEKDMENLAMDRVTIFVTHRCNLRCKYCNGPHLNNKIPIAKRLKMLTSDFPLALYKKLMKQWVKHGLKYIHFTGGEPTLHPQITEFVKIATDNGILSSITTNGTTNVDLLRKLINNGLYEIRISIDSFDPYVYESITGMLGSFEMVTKSIKEIVKMRDEEGKDIFLIINVVRSDFDINNMENTIEQIMKLKPDDMKILLDSSSREEIYSKGKRELINRLLQLFEERKMDMELLKDKILHLFRKNSMGLTDNESMYVMHKCYLPLTERTLDANGIYPCSIYLRNYGEPIANPNDSYGKQQREIIKWVNSAKCPLDDICRKHCTNCTKKFNLNVNKKLREKNIERESRNIIINADNLKKEKLKSIAKTLSKIKKMKVKNIKPYMIVKPEAQRFKDEIITYIKSQIYGNLEVIEIGNWNDISLFLYAKNHDGQNIEELRFMINNAHAKIDDDHATLILLPREVPLKKLYRIKKEIRTWFGTQIFQVTLPDNKNTIEIRNNYVHSPDNDKLYYELQVLHYFKAIRK